MYPRGCGGESMRKSCVELSPGFMASNSQWWNPETSRRRRCAGRSAVQPRSVPWPIRTPERSQLQRLLGLHNGSMLGIAPTPFCIQRGIPWKNMARTNPYSLIFSAWWLKSTGFSSRGRSRRTAPNGWPTCKSNWTSAGTCCGSGEHCARPAVTRRNPMCGRPRSSRNISAEVMGPRRDGYG